MVNYAPDRGDIVWLDFSPQSGHEQRGVRPALVISPKAYNLKIGLALFCPITSKAKGYPFEVPIKTRKINGVVLADQLRNLDWQVRRAKFIAKAEADIIAETLGKLQPLIS
ncbi:MAG: endoribonuclease MazF [Candidatus Margulisbacteria bacterium]|jgi:mRNA interferase MazF|nr:endoribonuclease MazF [Candidatus Margulisiibacteriota bacterium]